jgi:hypothetical protein
MTFPSRSLLHLLQSNFGAIEVIGDDPFFGFAEAGSSRRYWSAFQFPFTSRNSAKAFPNTCSLVRSCWPQKMQVVYCRYGSNTKLPLHANARPIKIFCTSLVPS